MIKLYNIAISLYLFNILLGFGTLMTLREEILYFVLFRSSRNKLKKFMSSYTIMQRLSLSFAKTKAKRYKTMCKKVLLFYQFYFIISIIILIICSITLYLKAFLFLNVWLGIAKILLDLGYGVHFYFYTNKTGSRLRVWKFDK